MKFIYLERKSFKNKFSHNFEDTNGRNCGKCVGWLVGCYTWIGDVRSVRKDFQV